MGSISLGYNGTSRRRRTVYGQTKAKVQAKLRELHQQVGTCLLDTTPG